MSSNLQDLAARKLGWLRTVGCVSGRLQNRLELVTSSVSSVFIRGGEVSKNTKALSTTMKFDCTSPLRKILLLLMKV